MIVHILVAMVLAAFVPAGAEAQTAPQTAPIEKPEAPAKPPPPPLCETMGSQLTGQEIFHLFSGARWEGENRFGARWTEKLGVFAGRIAPTTFQKRGGDPKDGYYDIRGDAICFSYGTNTGWLCRTLRKCDDPGALYVILDDGGGMASKITAFSKDPPAPLK